MMFSAAWHRKRIFTMHPIVVDFLIDAVDIAQ